MDPIDSELDNVLDAVKARSARQRRSRQVWVAGGTAAVFVLLLIVAARAGTRSDGALDVATPGTAATENAGTKPSTRGTTGEQSTTTPPTLVTQTKPAPDPTDGVTTTVVVDTTKVPTAPTTTQPPYPTSTLPHPIPDWPTTTSTTTPGVTMSLADAKALWTERRPAKYKMTIRRDCFCTVDYRGPFTVIVDGNTIVSPIPNEFLQTLTVDNIYAAAFAIGPEGSIGNLKVDPEFGYPTSIYLDPNAMMADEEMGYDILEFGSIE